MAKKKISKGELQPPLPTSGQVVGAIIMRSGIGDSKLRSKSAQRYFSGELDRRVSESNKKSVLRSVANALAELGLVPMPSDEDEKRRSLDVIQRVLWAYASNWDLLRNFLLPRRMRIFPDHLPEAWNAYVRLAVIDVAIRIVGYLYLTGTPPHVLSLLDWINPDRKGQLLNHVRREVGVSLEDLACQVGVSDNTVDSWMYKGSRPRSEHIDRIAGALVSQTDEATRATIASDLRRFYWLRSIVDLLAEHIGKAASREATERLMQYAATICSMLGDDYSIRSRMAERADPIFLDLFLYGARSDFAKALLSTLSDVEPDDEWQEDLKCVAVDWAQRVLAVNQRIHDAEVDDLNERTGGQLLRDWDVSSPEAYAHYQRSQELQLQGRISEALAEVAKAAALDPLDPANHFTLGSAKGGIGARNGDATLVEDGLRECWIAVRLDPNWILPWTEIGWILINTGRDQEAIDHLKAVPKECGPLNARYYAALGTAYRNLGDFHESLDAYEHSLEIEPQDLNVVLAARLAATGAGHIRKARHYEKLARHWGA